MLPTMSKKAGLLPQPGPSPCHCRERKRRNRCNYGCRDFCVDLIACPVCFVAVVLYFWASASLANRYINPRAPQYVVHDVRITGLETSAVEAARSNGTLNIETSFEIEARNPNNRIEIFYDEINVRIEALGVVIGHGTLTPFQHGYENTSYLNVSLRSGNLNFKDSSVADLLVANEAGRVPLSFKVAVRARTVVWAWFPVVFLVDADCGIVVDPSSSNGGGQIINKSCMMAVDRVSLLVFGRRSEFQGPT